MPIFAILFSDNYKNKQTFFRSYCTVMNLTKFVHKGVEFEALLAPRGVRCGEGVSIPLPTGMGCGERAVPPLQKILDF